MSSATSIEERDLPAKAGSHTSSNHDQGFRPWHFFVLASLAASTVAVMVSRQSAPEHLILISLTIGAAGFAAAAVYRTIVPLTVRDPSKLAERPSERARSALEREKTLVLRSIKELEFDRAMGKVSAKDFDEMGGRMRARAMNLMKQLDAGGSGYREAIERELSERLRRPDSPDLASAGSGRALDGGGRPAVKDAVARACASCETTNDPDAMFCKRCGMALATVQ
jgi:hypothetical protein